MQPTQALQRSVKRLTLTTKQTGKGFYKGTRTGAMGTHTRYGTYKIDWKKVRTYVVPSLEGFEVNSRIPQLSDCDGTIADASTAHPIRHEACHAAHRQRKLPG